MPDILHERALTIHAAATSVATFAAAPGAAVPARLLAQIQEPGGKTHRIGILRFLGSTAGQTISGVKVAVRDADDVWGICHEIVGTVSISDVLGYYERLEDVALFKELYVFGTLSSGTISVLYKPVEG